MGDQLVVQDAPTQEVQHNWSIPRPAADEADEAGPLTDLVQSSRSACFAEAARYQRRRSVNRAVDGTHSNALATVGDVSVWTPGCPPRSDQGGEMVKYTGSLMV